MNATEFKEANLRIKYNNMHSTLRYSDSVSSTCNCQLEPTPKWNQNKHITLNHMELFASNNRKNTVHPAW